MADLARMLVTACDEALAEGHVPEFDPAVTIISGRIGFLSAADSLTSDEWRSLLIACERGDPGQLKLNHEVMS